ncbi:hypothetical protein MBM_04214 [Drepanopeziza brunnea f. sp. 'multigermtubi' MB_m1]|uniref:Uncharacterized protein n=1 Tax=Marssonina brunnea f. sp. multigermtubi (strain MB_m1) TaxID=1072389 RepID=K1X9D1_MARBU|nr:uncharacterized protein MBM_04214 [Drepanopeziza brunnea f. sp. 'multigermtubi' MB_m1]EKD17353.1 hypothetical protein MBM_04214 [Drepanopeziza brunnea f. sp. 'multigermtubi' MB_m1]
MSIPLFYNAMVEVNPFSISGNKLINEIPGRYKDFVVVYADGSVVNLMFTCYDREDTALFSRSIGLEYEWKGRKGFIDEFGIKHYGANKKESAQVFCLLDYFVFFFNAIRKQFTYEDVKVRLILGDFILKLFDSDHAEAKSILKELLMLYPFTIDGTLGFLIRRGRILYPPWVPPWEGLKTPWGPMGPHGAA